MSLKFQLEKTRSKAPISWTPWKLIKLSFIMTYFFLGCISITSTQFLFILFTFYNDKLKRLSINFTKTNFIILLVSVLQIVSPTKLIITHDDTILPETFEYIDVSNSRVLRSNLESNAIVIANHQIYVDWVYLWFFAYCNRVGNNVYIIMKDSLKKIPILGYGMKNFNFIFLSRKWENDRSLMTDQLAKIDHYCRAFKDKLKYPNLQKYWIILFPEGTNMSRDRLEKSNNWCDKIGTPRMRNELFPRVKGLYFTTLKLAESTRTIYNVTLGYSGIRKDQFAQDVYTMKQIFINGAGPEQVHIHFSKTDISEIENFRYDHQTLTEEEDLANQDNFEKWLIGKWYLKDELLDEFYKTGEFGKGRFLSHEIELRIKSYTEVARIFVVPVLFLLFAYYCIGLIWN